MINETIRKEQNEVVEIEADTVIQAIRQARSRLKDHSMEELIIEILKEEQNGLFGMQSAKPAKIKVTVKSLK